MVWGSRSIAWSWTPCRARVAAPSSENTSAYSLYASGSSAGLVSADLASFVMFSYCAIAPMCHDFSASRAVVVGSLSQLLWEAWESYGISMLFPNSDSVYDGGCSPSMHVLPMTRPSFMTMSTLPSSMAAITQSIFSRESVSPSRSLWRLWVPYEHSGAETNQRIEGLEPVPSEDEVVSHDIRTPKAL
jgi:hypothetical protein